MHSTISYLKHKSLLWQANQTQAVEQGQHTGFKELDDALQGGFPHYGVVDIRSPLGIGELRLLLPSILTRQQQRPQEFVAFIAPPMAINSEMLAEFGLTLAQVIIVQPNQSKHALWSTEQILKSGCCHTALIWQTSLSVTHTKRLQLAAEKGHSLLFVMRQPLTEHISLPVTLGLQLDPCKYGIKAQITKRKGACSKKPFSINMYHYWPELTQPEHKNVLAFALRTSQAS